MEEGDDGAEAAGPSVVDVPTESPAKSPKSPTIPKSSRVPKSPTGQISPIRNDTAFSRSETNPDGVQVTITRSIQPGRMVITKETVIPTEDDDPTITELQEKATDILNSTFSLENPMFAIEQLPSSRILDTTITLEHPFFPIADLPDPQGFPALPPIPKKKLPPRQHAPGCSRGCGGKCLRSGTSTTQTTVRSASPQTSRAVPARHLGPRTRSGSAPGAASARVSPSAGSVRSASTLGVSLRPAPAASRPPAKHPALPAGTTVTGRKFEGPTTRATREIKTSSGRPVVVVERKKETLRKYVLKKESEKNLKRQKLALEDRPPWVDAIPSTSSAEVYPTTQEPQQFTHPALVPVEPYYPASLLPGMTPQQLFEYTREQIGSLSPDMEAVAMGNPEAMLELALHNIRVPEHMEEHIAHMRRLEGMRPEDLFRRTMEDIQLPQRHQQRMDERLRFKESQMGVDPRLRRLPPDAMQQFEDFAMPQPRSWHSNHMSSHPSTSDVSNVRFAMVPAATINVFGYDASAAVARTLSTRINTTINAALILLNPSSSSVRFVVVIVAAKKGRARNSKGGSHISITSSPPMSIVFQSLTSLRIPIVDFFYEEVFDHKAVTLFPGNIFDCLNSVSKLAST